MRNLLKIHLQGSWEFKYIGIGQLDFNRHWVREWVGFGKTDITKLIKEKREIIDKYNKKARVLGEDYLDMMVNPYGDIVLKGINNQFNGDEVRIPPIVQIIDSSAFQVNTSIRRVICEGHLDLIAHNAFAYSSLREITVNTVDKIDYGVFMGCSELIKVNGSEYIREIGGQAFLFCSKLKEINIDSCEKIRGAAFARCTDLVKIKLSDKLTNIPYEAFSNCKSLVDINTGHIKVIDQSAFSDCESLTEIQLDSIRNIGHLAFNDCKSLKRVIGAYKLEHLYSYAFKSCISLDYVETNIKSVSLTERAFYRCRSLKGIHTQNGFIPIEDFVDPNDLY